MFASLCQGSLIYILDKQDGVKLKIGEVVSVSAPHVGYPFPNQTVDIKINVDGNVYDYNSVPSSNSIITYNNGRITISETKQGLQSEVETLLANSKKVVDSIGAYKKTIEDCGNILKELNPEFAKDLERDTRINNLEEKLDKILTLLDK